MAAAATHDLSESASGAGAVTVPTFTTKPNYTNAAVLAPMVRCGTLPLRLQCLSYGADLTWSEELIAYKVAKCKRREDTASGIVTYECHASEGGGVGGVQYVYATSPEERGRNILQLGAPAGPIAVAAANVLVRDIAGVDVNMGCPKPFSLQGKMGAHLLTDVECAADIVRSLSRNVGSQVGVTCKIRLLPTLHQTCDFIRAMVSAGADAVTVHCRTALERPKDYAHWDVLPTLCDACTVPLIINGDAFTPEDVAQVRANNTRSGSVMIARGALANPSIFQAARGGELLAAPPLVADYIALAKRVHNAFPNTKYTTQSMLTEGGWAMDDAMFRSKSYEDLEAWVNDWVERYQAGSLRTSSRLRSAFSAHEPALFVDRPDASAAPPPPRGKTAGNKRAAAERESASASGCSGGGDDSVCGGGDEGVTACRDTKRIRVGSSGEGDAHDAAAAAAAALARAGDGVVNGRGASGDSGTHHPPTP